MPRKIKGTVEELTKDTTRDAAIEFAAGMRG